jgi:hypothetical protein
MGSMFFHSRDKFGAVDDVTVAFCSSLACNKTAPFISSHLRLREDAVLVSEITTKSASRKIKKKQRAERQIQNDIIK